MDRSKYMLKLSNKVEYSINTSAYDLLRMDSRELIKRLESDGWFKIKIVGDH